MRRSITTSGIVFCILVAGAGGPPVYGDFDSGSDGSDGAFMPSANTVIDLSLAGTGAGHGTYDTARWAVVFNYTAVNIPANVTVTFSNHPKGAPVVWLAQGNVVIAGVVNLSGADGTTGMGFATPGPGGFAGARSGNGGAILSCGGFGPGGAPRSPSWCGAGGGYGTLGGGGQCGAPVGVSYGNVSIIPLIGGSGGSATTGTSAGAGGGAILIASSTRITLNGTVAAYGGNADHPFSSDFAGGGSGGAIRLMANTIEGSGGLAAVGGYGGTDGGGIGAVGRIRLEAGTITFSGTSGPQATYGTPGPVFPPAVGPTLRITQIAGVAVPADPDAGINTPDVAINSANPVTVYIEATNVPVGTTVSVRIIPEQGDEYNTTSTPLAGTMGHSTATAVVPFDRCRSEIQLKANWTP